MAFTGSAPESPHKHRARGDSGTSELQKRVFGTDDIILHTMDIVRGKKGFERLKCDVEFRNGFYSALNDLMRALHYRVVEALSQTPGPVLFSHTVRAFRGV